MKTKRNTKTILWVATGALLVVALGTALWMHRFHRYTPMEVAQDIQAGIAARNTPEPVEQFLELRYGALTEPANRQKAFLDFFNVGHIEGLQIITSHMRDGERQTNVAAMARWVANYRRTMSPEEKQELRAQLGTEEGHRMLQQAAAQYLKQDEGDDPHFPVVQPQMVQPMADLGQSAAYARQGRDPNRRFLYAARWLLLQGLFHACPGRGQRTGGAIEAPLFQPRDPALLIVPEILPQGVAADTANLADQIVGQIQAFQPKRLHLALHMGVGMLEPL